MADSAANRVSSNRREGIAVHARLVKRSKKKTIPLIRDLRSLLDEFAAHSKAAEEELERRRDMGREGKNLSEFPGAEPCARPRFGGRLE
jgi:hypothetical protein